MFADDEEQKSKLFAGVTRYDCPLWVCARQPLLLFIYHFWCGFELLESSSTVTYSEQLTALPYLPTVISTISPYQPRLWFSMLSV